MGGIQLFEYLDTHLVAVAVAALTLVAGFVLARWLLHQASNHQSSPNSTSPTHGEGIKRAVHITAPSGASTCTHEACNTDGFHLKENVSFDAKREDGNCLHSELSGDEASKMSDIRSQVECFPQCLSQDDIYRLKNKKAVDEIMPYALKMVLKWGSNKPSGKTFLKYLEERNVEDKRFFDRYKESLDVDEVRDFDVTFLCDIIPLACENIAKNGTQEFESRVKDTNTIEFVFRELRDLRNNIIHQPKGDSVSPKVLLTLKTILIKLINLAGEMFSKSPQQIKEQVEVIGGMVESLREAAVTEKQMVMAKIKAEIITNGKNQMRDMWLKHCVGTVFPFSDTKLTLDKIFTSIKLELAGMKGKGSKEIPCEELFNFWSTITDVSLLIIEGTAGAGKTTLLRRITQDFLEINSTDQLFAGVRQFDFLVYIDCKKNYSTIREMMEATFYKTLKHISGKDADEAMRGMDLLVLIDGIDELNLNSKNLLKEVLEWLKSSGCGHFIATSRPSASMDFRKIIQGEGIAFRTLQIKEISDKTDQSKFLQRYENEIMQQSTSSKMVDSFNSLDALRNHFVCPVYLTLFCHLFITSPNSMKNWTNECVIMQETLKVCEVKMADRLIAASIKNPKTIASLILDVICDVSLQCLHQSKLFIDEKMYKVLTKRCFKHINKEIDYDEILSCLFTPERSADGTSAEYHYFHESQQEYLACLALTRRLYTAKGTSLRVILADIVDDDVDHVDSKRFLNVFYFTLLEMSGERRLKSYLPALCSALQDAGAEFDYWADIVVSYKEDEAVAKEGAKAAAAVAFEKTEDGDLVTDGWYESSTQSWKVTTDLQVEAASRMLPHFQPPVIDIEMPRLRKKDIELGSLLLAVRKHHEGKLVLRLHNSYWDLRPADDYLKQLDGAKCQLRVFSGCLATREGVSVLVSIPSQKMSLFITVPDPLQHHLDVMDGTDHRLWVRFQYSPCNAAPHSHPLPEGRGPPWLIIDDIPQNEANNTAALILAVAPKAKRFRGIWLHQCQLKGGCRDELLWVLHESGIRTKEIDGGYTRSVQAGKYKSGDCLVCIKSTHEEDKPCLQLHITDSPPQNPKFVDDKPDQDLTSSSESSGEDSPPLSPTAEPGQDVWGLGELFQPPSRKISRQTTRLFDASDRLSSTLGITTDDNTKMSLGDNSVKE